MSWEFPNKLGARAVMGMSALCLPLSQVKVHLLFPVRNFLLSTDWILNPFCSLTIHPTTIVHLLCAGCHSRHLRYISEQKRQRPLPSQSLHSRWWGWMVKKQTYSMSQLCKSRQRERGERRVEQSEGASVLVGMRLQY